MVLQAAADNGMGSQAPTRVAVVTAQAMLAMLIRDAVSRHPEIDLQLVAARATDLAAFTTRDRLDIVLCEPFDANDVCRLHPGRRMLILGRDTVPQTLLHDLISHRPSRNRDGQPHSPLSPDHKPERRRGEVGINRRQFVGWLLYQKEQNITDLTDGTNRSEWLLHSLPHLGKPTTLIFLSTKRIPSFEGEWDRLSGRLRVVIHEEDALLRLDDDTLTILTALVEPMLTPSLLTRLSWRIWPADPLAVVTRAALFGRRTPNHY